VLIPSTIRLAQDAGTMCGGVVCGGPLVGVDGVVGGAVLVAGEEGGGMVGTVDEDGDPLELGPPAVVEPDVGGVPEQAAASDVRPNARSAGSTHRRRRSLVRTGTSRQ
jgi:hypothetical protein